MFRGQQKKIYRVLPRRVYLWSNNKADFGVRLWLQNGYEV